MQLRILVVSQYFWPENFRINDLVMEMVSRGHHVTVLTGLPNYPLGKVFDEYLKQPKIYCHFEGADVIRLPMLPRGTGNLRLFLNYISFMFSAYIFGTWHLRNKSFDVIFVFEPSPATVGLPAVWFGQIKRSPVVFWVLDLWPETLAALGIVRSGWLLSLVGLMVRFIYKRCTLILGQSQSFLYSIKKYCEDKTKIRYFPTWAESCYSDSLTELAPEVPSVSDVFTIVFAGNIGEAQDMPSVLAAAELLKGHANIRWVIVGDGRKLQWLRSEVVRRGLAQQVLLPGQFPVDRMPSFYAHADALLVSLKRDSVFSMTIPGKVQSYLMAGLPLLGMLDGEGATIICDAGAGITCNAGDSEGLSEAVLRLAGMSINERRQMGFNGLRYAEKEFGRAELMRRLESLLIEAATLRKARI